MLLSSCVVSSIARLAYTVDFFKVNLIGDYAVNFDSKSISLSERSD